MSLRLLRRQLGPFCLYFGRYGKDEPLREFSLTASRWDLGGQEELSVRLVLWCLYIDVDFRYGDKAR